ncbi:DNA internalization-related competence protein ComEC/Rec2 [Clostridiales bacterium]|nr:DNA internalization-related competence protein ComEC/Rec2 [Clostridiales bacterium]
MRRPMVFAAAGFGSGVYAAHMAELAQVAWAVTLFTAVSLWLILKALRTKKTYFVQAILFLCVFCVGGLLTQACEDQVDPLAQKVGTTATITGMVTSVSRKDETYQLKVKSSEGMALVSYYGRLEQELAGRQVEVRGHVFLPQQRRNPKCFDYRQYLRTRGIQVQISADSLVSVTGRGNAWIRMVSQIRGDFEKRLESCVDDETKGMVMAMLFGDKSALSEETYENFQKNGTAHILAVSGLHIGILYGFIAFLWPAKKGWLFYITVSGALLFYAALAEFAPSVVRATIMIAIHLAASVLHRRYDLLSAAAFTFLMMLCVNPLLLFHTGFQLSFLAIASLGVVLPFVQQMYQGVFLSSIGIQIGMLPYTAYVFNYVSLGAFFINVPVALLAGILLPVGIGAMVVSYVSQPLFQLSVLILRQGCEILTLLNDFVYAGGRTSFDVVSPPLFLLAAYYGALFLGISEKGRILFLRHEWKKLAICGTLIISVAAWTAAAGEEGFSKAQVIFVDVGQGDCVHVKTPEGKHYLLDGGGSLRYDVGKKTLKPYLLKNGVRKLDGAFVTHLHEDHYGGIRSLAEQGMVDSIGVYEGCQVMEDDLEQETGAKFLYLHKGQRVLLGKEVYLDILAPEKKTRQEYLRLAKDKEDENQSSLVMKLTYGRLSVLVTGDMDQEGEARLMQEYKSGLLRCDILKVAHHGSKYSSSEGFIRAASPSIAVFQVGKNNFGHPAQTVIEKYRQIGIMIYRNDTSGAIGIRRETGSRRISVQKMIW